MTDNAVTEVRVARRPPDEDKLGPWRRFNSAARTGTWLPAVVLLAVFAIAWSEYATHTTFVLPTFGEMWRTLAQNPGQFAKGVLVTFEEVAIGATCGIGAAFLMSVLMTEVRFLERAIMPLTVLLMVTPLVATAPILVIAFGFGSTPKIFIAGLILFAPMMIHTLAGLKNLDPRTLDLLYTLDANRWETFRFLRLRWCLPYVFVGLRIALPVSVVGASTAELVSPGSSFGLGGVLASYRNGGNLAGMWDAIFLLCVLGLAMMGVWALLRRRFLWWDNEALLAKRES